MAEPITLDEAKAQCRMGDDDSEDTFITSLIAPARAYVENDRRRYAAALLKMARETYPDDKALERLAAELDGPAPATPAADPV